MTQNRRQFFGTAKTGLGAIALLGLPSTALLPAKTGAGQQANPAVPESFPRQNEEAVVETVTVAHFNYDRVKELVSARPALAKACWDWGYGDWESALGAASHTGRRDIAELLIEHGAPAVRIRFDVVDGRASLLTVHDPMPLVKATRAGD